MQWVAALAIAVGGLSICLCPSSSSATLIGLPRTTGDQLPERGPRNPESEAARGWLQRLDGQSIFVTVSCKWSDRILGILAHRVTRQYTESDR